MNGKGWNKRNKNNNKEGGKKCKLNFYKKKRVE